MEEKNILKYDIGASFVKLQLNNGEPQKFPTVIRSTKKIDGFNLKSTAIEYKGNHYLVSRDGANSLLSRDLNFFKDYSPLLIYKGLELLGIKNTENLILNIGFSYLYINEFQQIVEQINCFEVNNNKYCFKAINCFIQGQGIYNFLSLNGTVAIYDIGFHTNDFLIFDNGDLTQNETNKNGIVEIVEALRNELNYKFNLTLSEHQTNQILQTKELNLDGEIADVSSIIEPLVNNYKQKIVNDLRVKYGSALRTCDHVVFSGGGAYYFDETDVPKGTTLLKDEYANAKGYLQDAIS
jgi:hypothetical protein